MKLEVLKCPCCGFNLEGSEKKCPACRSFFQIKTEADDLIILDKKIIDPKYSSYRSDKSIGEYFLEGLRPWEDL